MTSHAKAATPSPKYDHRGARDEAHEPDAQCDEYALIV